MADLIEKPAMEKAIEECGDWIDIKKKEFLNELDTSEYVNLSVHTLRKYRAKHIGPRFYKMNGSIRYRLGDIEDWLEACRITTKK
jgi:hypothetical protein